MTFTSTLDTFNPERLEQIISAAYGLPDSIEIPAIVLPEGAQIESLEHLLSAPYHMRRTYKTDRLEDFCRYVLDQTTDNKEEAAVFVASNGSGAKAIIDYGTHLAPRWGNHVGQLNMQHTVEFAALLQATNTRLNQRQLTDLLEDWAHIITPMRDQTSITISQAIAAIRKIDIKQLKNTSHETADFAATRSSMEQIEAASSGVSLPGSFMVRCQVYPHTAARDIQFRLSLLTGDDTPQLRLRIVGQDKLMTEIAEEIELEIATRLEGIRIFVGQV